MNKKLIFWLAVLLLSGCAQSPSAPPPQPTTVSPSPIPAATQTPAPVVSPTFTPVASTAIPTLTPAQTAVVPGFCSDPQPVTLINSLKKSMLESDGALLSSLVNPTLGMDVRFFRDGTVINYSPEKAKFLFETDFVANWGNEPGSGLPKEGSFHEVVIPALVEIFNKPYTLHCNELKHGGATYELEWPYQGNFYSVYFEGTDQNGFLDWHTWVIGIDAIDAKPYIYAMMQFFWEP